MFIKIHQYWYFCKIKSLLFPPSIFRISNSSYYTWCYEIKIKENLLSLFALSKIALRYYRKLKDYLRLHTFAFKMWLKHHFPISTIKCYNPPLYLSWQVSHFLISTIKYYSQSSIALVLTSQFPISIVKYYSQSLIALVLISHLRHYTTSLLHDDSIKNIFSVKSFQI